MKLLVRVIEARNIPALDPNGFSDPYVKLQLGRQKFRNEDKYFNDDFVGQIKVPVSQVFEAKDKTLGTTWYTLQPKNKKAKNKECGEILLTICFSQNNALFDVPSGDPVVLSKKFADTTLESTSRSSPRRTFSPMRSEEGFSSKEDKWHGSTFAGRIAQIFNKNVDSASVSSTEPTDASELPESMDSVVAEQKSEEVAISADFEEILKNMETKNQGGEVPSSLSGGSLADVQGSTELQIGPWKYENGGESLKRVILYTKAASKLIKALKTTEEQTYLKADGKCFAVLSTVSTPDAPYGEKFKVEVLYCITSGPEQPSGEQSSKLEVSWRVNFSQSTMMKGMIEGGTRQGIKESFEQYEKLLSQTVKPLSIKDIGSEKDQLLASLQVERQSDWKLAVQYFANFTVISTIFMGIYALVHVWLAMPSTIQGLEFVGLDLPDSIGELVVCGVLVLQGKRVLELVSRFMQARVQKGSDHGIKAQGDGWLLTVALIEGSNLAAVDSSGFSDPYVVFTCNGKTRTSSIKFQKSDPLWNEIFEFDAMEDPPSVLDVEVFDFDGPFDEATSLGRAEINFLKSNISDLSDVWIPLQGKLAQACQSKLHLRIFLNNSRGGNVVKEYITKMEKEVGKKIRLRSPQTNSAFQKLFGLPPEEFLINDFACHLRRRMPLQGRLFLSARVIGFHADLFGHKTKFFFLWEDIEDIQVIPPTLSSMGSPIIIMTLRPGRGFDARHGARTQDADGRLKYHFSFVSFNVAHRTIMALWKARALTPEQKVQIVEEESEANGIHTAEEESIARNLQGSEFEGEAKSLQVDEESEAKGLHTEESGSFLGVEDVNMSVVYSSILSIPTSFFMELFRGSEIDRRVMERGCLNYSPSPWESEKPDVYQRQLFTNLTSAYPVIEEK
ncbi:UNVERIFIED_CONTAM: C2 and GRAM domain-containing protein [Sesamum radiatum]|uniref:C2 and GRAM domain-containing protein n=1 Tax=Sesamum radiatum TaxID=300843 RepID=A0AAW2T5J5_SESRA